MEYGQTNAGLASRLAIGINAEASDFFKKSQVLLKDILEDLAFEKSTLPPSAVGYLKCTILDFRWP